MMPRSPRGWFMHAVGLRTIVQAPGTPRYRRDPAAVTRVDFSNERLERCIDISLIAERCDRTGFMAAFYFGMRWDAIPKGKQGQVAADIRRFRKELREGGYPVG